MSYEKTYVLFKLERTFWKSPSGISTIVNEPFDNFVYKSNKYSLSSFNAFSDSSSNICIKF